MKSPLAGIVLAAGQRPACSPAFEQWGRFYTFSGDRDVSFSSM